MEGHLIPSPHSPTRKSGDEESRKLTRRSSSFFIPNRVYPEGRPSSCQYPEGSKLILDLLFCFR